MKTKQQNSQCRALRASLLIPLTVIILFNCSHKTLAQQWSTSGDDIYNSNSGKVGIGTASPIYSLDVNGGVNGFRAKASTALANDTIATFESSSGIHMIVRANGNVGIGAVSPQSNLQIGTQTSTPTANPSTISLGGSYSSVAGANLKLKLYDDGEGANVYGIGVSFASMDFGVHSTAGYRWYAGGTNKMTLTSNGDLSVSGNISAKYQDLAEWVPSSEQLPAGTVVVLDASKSNQVIASALAYDTRVAGVISAQPGITLGEKGDDKVLVATTGRVRVKVDASRGPIQIGDLLVTSDSPGVAMKSKPVNVGGTQIHRPGTLIGKALEPLAKGQGEILVLLSLQ